MWIIRGWARPPEYGQLPSAVHRLLPKVNAALNYAQAQADAKARGNGGPW